MRNLLVHVQSINIVRKRMRMGRQPRYYYGAFLDNLCDNVSSMSLYVHHPQVELHDFIYTGPDNQMKVKIKTINVTN